MWCADVQDRGGKTKGTAVPCAAAELIEKLRKDSAKWAPAEYAAKELAAKDAAGVAYQTSAACWFLIAMALYPSPQRKAQAELDAVLAGRLPTFEDIPSLPYIQALLLESMRWAPVTPTGVHHRLLDGEDDEYGGYVIPSGAVIIPNIWAMLHDPATYPEPETFKPERFFRDGGLNCKVMDPLLAAFGFGRRICPGRYLAIDTLTLLIASLLSVYNVESTLPEPARPKATTGLISYPERVPVRLKPRSTAAVEAVRLGLPQNV
ncbi:hypothetical protein NM688_g5964 [Phlebia brevispora]|uniref:Uncharacterized protein n=1 Tax=Phlebia brevispora TaxID=194682 RepID=A0ACC1SM15_9APHY|nr:hypothetical protein NM688_g5964 [Phlebia brevispora]